MILQLLCSTFEAKMFELTWMHLHTALLKANWQYPLDHQSHRKKLSKISVHVDCDRQLVLIFVFPEARPTTLIGNEG